MAPDRETPRTGSDGLVIVIGAGPGVGAAVARAFGSRGHPLLLVGRDLNRVSALARELEHEGLQARPATADAAVSGQLTELIASTAEPLAAIIYNATGFGGPLLAAEPEELAAALQVSLFSLLEACRAGRPQLERTRGAVITTGGGFALYPSGELGVLSMAKAATRTASLLLAQELAPSGIMVRTVTIAGTVAPGGPFDPKAIAQTFLASLDQPDPEVVHTGE